MLFDKTLKVIKSTLKKPSLLSESLSKLLTFKGLVEPKNIDFDKCT